MLLKFAEAQATGWYTKEEFQAYGDSIPLFFEMKGNSFRSLNILKTNCNWKLIEL